MRNRIKQLISNIRQADYKFDNTINESDKNNYLISIWEYQYELKYLLKNRHNGGNKNETR